MLSAHARTADRASSAILRFPRAARAISSQPHALFNCFLSIVNFHICGVTEPFAINARKNSKNDALSAIISPRKKHAMQKTARKYNTARKKKPRLCGAFSRYEKLSKKFLKLRLKLDNILLRGLVPLLRRGKRKPAGKPCNAKDRAKIQHGAKKAPLMRGFFKI